MKFKLVENINEDILMETTVADKEVSKHLSADMSNQYYKPSSFFSTLRRHKPKTYAIILNNLHYYCTENNIDYSNIIGNWHAHHINGVHPNGVNHIYNQIPNIALITPHIHEKITVYNENIIRNKFSPYLRDKNRNLNKLIIRGIANCISMGINPSTIYRISTRNYSKLVKEVPIEIENNFRTMYPKSNNEVIYLQDLI